MGFRGVENGAEGMGSEEKSMTMNDKGAGKTECFLGISAPCRFLLNQRITRPGLEHLPGNAGQTALCEMPGPTGGPIGPDLQTVIDAWPHLNEATRAKILRDVQRALR